MQTGTIKTITDRGFGFIVVDGAQEGGKDLFFHSNELKNVKFEELREGDKVTFDVAEGQKGPNAVNVNKV